MPINMINVTDGLTPIQEKAIIALVSAPNVEKAAKACNVGLRTVYRWLDNPTFSAAYRKARRQAFTQAIGLVTQYSPLAVQTLAKIMIDPAAGYAARVAAAACLLRFSRDAVELDDLSQRLEALEASAGIGPPRRPLEDPPELIDEVPEDDNATDGAIGAEGAGEGGAS